MPNDKKRDEHNSEIFLNAKTEFNSLMKGQHKNVVKCYGLGTD